MERSAISMPSRVSRGGFIGSAALACLLSPIASVAAATGPGLTETLTKSQRDALTPSQVLDALKQGNQRFRNGTMTPRNYIAQARATAAGQYPAAAILGCVDSRVPSEIIFDVGIGDTFNARVAGNVVNDDMLGSIEFACAVSGAKLVLILGHTACGAIKGAIDDVELGNLTGLLARIKPAITQTTHSGEKSSKNYAYVDAVARTNVAVQIENVRRRSSILKDLQKKGSIQIVGAMYDLATGEANFIT
jgi:carbonic anhydrase